MNNSYPNLFLIGGMRCGSTALHLLLDQHDDINMSSNKEPCFFIAELKRQELLENYSKDLEDDLVHYINKGKYRTVDKYIALFDYSRHYKYRGEASHYMYTPETARIIQKISPGSKIIITVRNPVDRLYSEYLYHSRIDKRKRLNFSKYVTENVDLFRRGDPSKIGKGLYHDAVLNWIKTFGNDNVKIVIYEEFKEDQQRVLNELYNWLNLSDSKIANLTPQKTGRIRLKKIFFLINSSTIIKGTLKLVVSKKNRIKIRSFFYSIFIAKKKKSDISKSDVKRLLEVYREDVIELGKLLKKDLTFWLEM